METITMARLLAMYKTPADKAAFDAYYFNKHCRWPRPFRDCGNTKSMPAR